MNQSEVCDLMIDIMRTFLRTPDGIAMIFEEAEKACLELGMSNEEFRRHMGVLA